MEVSKPAEACGGCEVVGFRRIQGECVFGYSDMTFYKMCIGGVLVYLEGVV